MRTWLFQGNPDDFNLDGYLATRPPEFPWLVRRYADDIAVGDRVYIWRTQGKQATDAGVIAEAEVIAPPALRPESPDAVRFWRAGAAEATAPLTRALLRLVRVAGRGEVIQRKWCIEDPVLRDLPNVRMAAATNYPLSQGHAKRLAALWSRTGHDWTRDESIAGLWAYAQTYGGLGVEATEQSSGRHCAADRTRCERRLRSSRGSRCRKFMTLLSRGAIGRR